MKKIFYVLAMIGGTAMASDFTNFSGEWLGTCTFNGRSKDSQKSIIQTGGAEIQMDGQTFFLTKPTSMDVTSSHNGENYHEVTVYDFSWNEDFNEILTSAKWLGWYLDKNGTWSGEGSGIIRIENDTLITTRSFKSTFGEGEEVCNYARP